ncbi:site-specific integrase [Spirosoma sp. BT702]|uniref:Site-specific integrase n=1 Tax=Spirosoma profusum TaxID=2771354 RepID=A0A926XTQ7_9BACT|nr:site-specific integrase [Spirosoma profusum]MBD2700178.1 site-specific integrase [Spirosoma profusum]
MARKWQLFLNKQITPSPVKYPFKEPFISKPEDNDLTKQWVVEYGIYSEREQKIKRKRVVLKGDTVADRLKDGREVVGLIKQKLKAGACVDPQAKAPEVLVRDQADQVGGHTMIRQAIDLYLAYKQKTTSVNSWRTYRSSLRLFKQYLLDTPGLKNVTLANFHHGDALHFLDQVILKYGLTNRGHNNAKDNVGMFYRHWLKRINRPGKLAIVNPFDDIQDKTTHTNKHTAFTDEQRETFKEICRKENETNLLLFVQFMFYTFFRPRQELRLIRVGDIKADTIYVNAEEAKDNEGAYIEIPPPLQALIEQYKLRTYPPHFYVFTHQGVPGSEPVGPDYFYQHHVRILAKLGWKGKYDMYSWKHTGVIALWSTTQNIRLIQQHCRHSTAAQTEDYLRDLGIIVRHTQIQDFPEF